MADYYPLIARAIAGLDPSASGETRRALYERARTALIAQLRNVEPALTEADITRERLALEAAVRKVESETAQRARSTDSRAGSRPRPGETPGERQRPGDALRESARNSRSTAPISASRDRFAARNERASEAEERQPRNLRTDPPRESPPTRNAEDRGRDLRTEDPRIETRPTPRQEYRPNNRGDVKDPSISPRDSRISAGEQPSSRRTFDDDRSSGANKGLRGIRDAVADAENLGRATAEANRAAREDYSHAAPAARGGRYENDVGEIPYSYDESVDEAVDYQPRAPRARTAPREGEPSERRFPVKRLLQIGLASVVLGLLVLAAVKLYPLIKSSSWPSQQTEAPASGDAATRPKITDRVGQPGSSSSQQIAAVAQRVVLYDEDPSEPQGKQYVGSVIWRTENVKGAGGKTDIGVRADIEIPDRKIKMTFSLRRNNDATLPASHTAELTFVLPPDFPNGSIANVPGVLMKSNEQARGTPLAGLAVKVTDGFFLVGLSNVETDRVRNLQLLKERLWFDIPVVYSNQRRGIIAIEKGAPGERAFSDAFAAWGQ